MVQLSKEEEQLRRREGSPGLWAQEEESGSPTSVSTALEFKRVFLSFCASAFRPVEADACLREVVRPQMGWVRPPQLLRLLSMT